MKACTVWLHIPIDCIPLTTIKINSRYKSNNITNSLQPVLIFFINFSLLFSTYTDAQMQQLYVEQERGRLFMFNILYITSHYFTRAVGKTK